MTEKQKKILEEKTGGAADRTCARQPANQSSSVVSLVVVLPRNFYEV